MAAMISIITNNSESASYMVVKNLGLCVLLTDYLTTVLNVNAITQIIACVMGMVGAAISLRVTTLRQHRSSLSIQVSILSLYDMLFLFAVLFLAIFRLNPNVYTRLAFGVFYVLRMLGLWGVSYTMVVITIDRCLYIARPFLAKRICGVKFTLKRSAAILISGICFVLPFVLDLIVGLSTESCTKERKLTVYGVVYTLYISVLLLYLLPFLTIIIANAILIYALRRFGKQTQIRVANTSSEADSSARHLSVFVMGISAWYVLCMITPSIFFLVRLSRVEVFRPERDFTAGSSAETLIVLSTATNFVFYFLMWKNFRHSFLMMFCSRCRTSSNVSREEQKLRQRDDIYLHSVVTCSFHSDNAIER